MEEWFLGMIAGILGNNFINSCTGITVEGTTVAIRKKLMVEKKLFLLHFH
jgi:hypothetical protein